MHNKLPANSVAPFMENASGQPASGNVNIGTYCIDI